MSRSLIRKTQLHPDISDLVGQYGSGFFISDEQVVYKSGNQTISGAITFNQRPNVNGSGILVSGEASVNSTLPKDTESYARMPFGIRGNSAASATNLITGRASIVPFYINNQITGYKAISNRIGNSSNGPWTVRVALYNINNGISSPIFLESSNVGINAGITQQQRIANFTGNGKDLNIGWYANVSWLVSGIGAISNSTNFTWSNRAVIGSKTGLNLELPGSFSELFYIITGLSGAFYQTGVPPNIGTIMTTDGTATNTPWFFPFY